MRQPSFRYGAIAGLVTSLPTMALLYLGQQLAGLAFIPFDLFDLLARALPGNVITLGIDLIVSIVGLLGLESTDTTAKAIEQLLALLMFAGAGSLYGVLITFAVRRFRSTPAAVGSTVGLLVLLFVLVIEFALGDSTPSPASLLWLAGVFIGWGAILGHLLAPSPIPYASEEAQLERRQVLLKLVGGSAALAFSAWGLGRLLDVQEENTGAGQPLAAVTPAAPVAASTAVTLALPTPVHTSAAETAARESISPAPGTRPELTSNANFYRIDINTRSLVLREDEWQLQTAGLFANPRSLALADLMAFPAITQPITLSCISNRIGGDLIGTSNWTGARLRDVIKDLGIQPGARALVLEAADGFHETVVIQDMLDPQTLLVYGMNGETLPVNHGFPLRIYIPNRYGMKQPKWIVRMTAVSEEEDGYWVKRGWSREARPQIVSVIDTVALDKPTPSGHIPIGGIAWAGNRGIQKVELEIDDQPWVEADLRNPPLSPLTWVQWRFDWPATAGRHRIRVRATDGTGALQIEEGSGARPDGATGYQEKQVRI